MWIAYAVLSVVFTMANFVFAWKGKEGTRWMVLCAFSFTALTVLAQYSLIGGWVSREDWSALMDVVPGVYAGLTEYVLFMIAANAAAVFVYGRGKKKNP